MTYSTNYRTVLIEQKPEKEGWYTMVHKDGWMLPNRAYFSKRTNEFDGRGAYWLQEVPDSAVVTRQELEKMITQAFKDGASAWELSGTRKKFEESNKQTIDNLLKSK